MQRKLHVTARVHTIRRGGRLLMSVGLIAFTASGCSGAGPGVDDRVRAAVIEESKRSAQEGWTEKAEALADGSLTDEENAALSSQYRECMSKAGIELSEPTRSPIDGRSLLYTETNLEELTAADNEPSFRCLARFDTGAAIADLPGPMAEPLRRHVADCLRQREIATASDARTLREIVATAGRSNEGAIRTCLDDGMASEYPDLGYSYGLPNSY